MPYGFVGSSVSIRNSFPLWAKSNVTVWKWSIGRGVKRGIGDLAPHSERPHNTKAVATCGTRKMTGFNSPASWAFVTASFISAAKATTRPSSWDRATHEPGGRPSKSRVKSVTAGVIVVFTFFIPDPLAALSAAPLGESVRCRLSRRGLPVSRPASNRGGVPGRRAIETNRPSEHRVPLRPASASKKPNAKDSHP